MVYACCFFCCLFAPGALLCVNVTDEVQSSYPFYNQTVEGYLPEIDRNRIVFPPHFLLHGFQWPEFLDCKKLPAPPKFMFISTVTMVLFSVSSTSSVWSTSSAPSDQSAPSAPSTPSVSWYYCFIVLAPLLFVILGFSFETFNLL